MVSFLVVSCAEPGASPEPCVSLPAQDTLWFYDSILLISGSAETFSLPDDALTSFSHRLSSMVKPARMHRMQRTKFYLCSGQHCHCHLCWTPIPLQIISRRFSPFPALTTATSPIGAVGEEQSLHTEFLFHCLAHRTPYNVSHASESHLFLY